MRDPASCVSLQTRRGSVMTPRSALINGSHQHLFYPHLAGDIQGQLQVVMDEAAGLRGGGDELQSGGSSGTVINGILPETSAARLSIIGQLQNPLEGITVRSLAGGGPVTTPSEVFIAAFCHYMMKVIADMYSSRLL